MIEEHQFWFMQAKDFATMIVAILTILAIYYGPIAAVRITRSNDEDQAKKKRQFDVFHSLMKTRRFTLSADHVMALNLVQIEFYEHTRIDAAYRAYIGLLSVNPPSFNSDVDRDVFYQNREDAMYNLLYEIAEELGYRYDKRDLQRLAYGPKGWHDDETQQRALRSLLIELLSGHRSFPVIAHEQLQQPQSKFPPPPND